MAVETTLVIRWEKYPPPNFEQLLEDEFECIVIATSEEDVG